MSFPCLNEVIVSYPTQPGQDKHDMLRCYGSLPWTGGPRLFEKLEQGFQEFPDMCFDRHPSSWHHLQGYTMSTVENICQEYKRKQGFIDSVVTRRESQRLI